MDAYRCKLCFKSFANGRALGGHMRSHISSGLGESAQSSSSSSSSSEEENEFDKGLLNYGLRENPKKSIRLVDPEFNFAIDTGSVILQDRESETESSKNPIRRRSKRIRKSGISRQLHDRHPKPKKPKSEPKLGKTVSSWADPEPVSSISDTTQEEDVAYCLMMLSRDKWRREEEEREDEFGDPKPIKANIRRKYKCETCFKVFKSYQALGGHRASHMKTKANNNGFFSNCKQSEEKIHQCPVCFRVFSSGQALGGHKRSHVLNGSKTTTTTTSISPVKPPLKSGMTLIDLNLPAPIDDGDDDEISQIEVSAVSDAEFLNPIEH